MNMNPRNQHLAAALLFALSGALPSAQAEIVTLDGFVPAGAQINSVGGSVWLPPVAGQLMFHETIPQSAGTAYFENGPGISYTSTSQDSVVTSSPHTLCINFHGATSSLSELAPLPPNVATLSWSPSGGAASRLWIPFQVTTPATFTLQANFLQSLAWPELALGTAYAVLFIPDSQGRPLPGSTPLASYGFRTYPAGFDFTPPTASGISTGTLVPGYYVLAVGILSTSFAEPSSIQFPIGFPVTQHSASGTVSFTLRTDSDSDSLPDEWELAHFGSLAHSGSDDPDGDGEDNTFEFIAGTDPADASAHLILEPVSSSPASRVFQLNQVRPGIRYCLESSTELATWDTVTTQTFQNAGPGEIRDDRPGTAEAARRFYRVRVEP